MADDGRRRPPPPPQWADALGTYNPNFSLTPQVLAIMRAFFADLRPDDEGTISREALADEIARLAPSLATDQRLDMAPRDERLDFAAFCEWVMRCKAQHPQSVQNVYTSWATQLAALDFGLSDGESLLFDWNHSAPPAHESLARETVPCEIVQLLQRRRLARKRPESSSSSAGAPNVRSQHEHEIVSGADGGQNGRLDGTGPAHEAVWNPADRKLVDVAADQTVGADGNKDSMLTVSKSFLAGGMAGIVAKSALAPLDRIKILFQVDDQRKFNFRNALRMANQIYVHDGFHALFRGNMLNILRVIPYAGLQHSGFDFFRHKFHAHNFKKAEKEEGAHVPKLSNVQLVTAGSLAGGVSLIVAYPLDIVRARYMVQMGKHRYTSIWEAVVTMYKVDGMRSFSRGLLPSLLGTLPYTGIGFSLNERFKAWALEFQHRRLERKHGQSVPGAGLNTLTKFGCSYLAACIAQTSTYPLDTIRRRIQTDGYASRSRAEIRYTGVISTARTILAREGWRGLFKGVSVNWMRSPVSTGISLTAYDILKEVMGVEKIE
ncbi:unnamed protein product [Hyaloperonospora brassicae]|uniref:EF-hand domain-containing protein n=1 Tax=Hyaloperonospora brassicae TaxID=162125 RepID=A0AAV0V0C0_HYABA|nr:unnamed protein product [Hyaloperonospora brassicae]